MPTVEQLRSRLIDKLKELFQLDQPDLDFGFYRIMHAKSEQVTRFLENDLLKIVSDAFGDGNEGRLAELRQAYEAAVEQARRFGAADPEQTAPVREAKAALEAAADTTKAEAEVYDHLFRFFERYYEDGDFISRRYYTRETPGKAAPYAIPYNGEEVKLHWANADQYYIKTTEHFSNFTFDLRAGVKKQLEQNKKDKTKGELLFDEAELDGPPLRVHFQIVSATEGEHGNVKASEQTKRYFIIHQPDPVGFNDAGELVCRFEFRPDPEKSGQENTWRDKRNAAALETLLAALDNLADGDGRAKRYADLLRTPAPTEKDKQRPLLAKYVNQYTARNTMDYFIHKDLGGFLRRELDFYLKNEVMRLDDIASADASRVEQYLAKLKVLREISGKLIDFLAQLEDFQKRLWLKRKFVVATGWCVSIGAILSIQDEQIREALLAEIIDNSHQRNEWIRLHAINAIGPELDAPGFSDPLTHAFLGAHPSLMIDTKNFRDAFCTRLISALSRLDERTDALLINAENFHALRLLAVRQRASIRSVYIDPPFNTAATPIAYKNEYKHSSWMALMEDRLRLARQQMCGSAMLCVAIDDAELARLTSCLSNVFAESAILATVTVRSNPHGRAMASGFSINHEYAVFVANGSACSLGRLPRDENRMARYPSSDDDGPFTWINFRKTGAASGRRDRPTLYYPVYADEQGRVRVPELSWSDSEGWVATEEQSAREVVIWPLDSDGSERCWTLGVERARAEAASEMEARETRGQWQVYRKYRPHEEGALPGTWWDDAKYSATESGTKVINDLMGDRELFSYPKSVYLLEDCLRVLGGNGEGTILDFFGGSGTTGHAAINLNRSDGRRRTFTIIEMGSYFESVLLPRLKKVAFAPEWSDGKPSRFASSAEVERGPQIMKYLRLESYEDALNNLDLCGSDIRDAAMEEHGSLRCEYTLKYMLDIETQGSPSLLNIDGFADPSAYELKVKKLGSDEYERKNVDLLETFNYLIGLRVEHIAVPQTFTAEFERPGDPELPEDQHTRLAIKGWQDASRRGTFKQAPDGPWWFRKVEGWVPKDPNNPNNGDREKVLIVWRKLPKLIELGPEGLEQDNLMLDAWFEANRISTRDFEFDTIYVNGSNNLPNLKQEGDNWKVRLLEEDFHKLMWDVEDV